MEVLKRPSKKIGAGKYKVFLTPAAVEEFLGILNWGGSKKAIETKSSPLNHLASGMQMFSSKVSMTQNTKEGFGADFDDLGNDLPDKVDLVLNGAFTNALVSSRSSMEYGAEINAGNERFDSMQLSAGNLKSSEAIKELGEGIYISNVWYTNFSDQASGKVTGMTRFATFWVENGEVSCPVDVMRFDVSLFDVFGENLISLTEEREQLLDPGTYSQRSVSSSLIPGMLVKDFEFTL